MYEFTTISGRVIEARRYMNRWPRLNEPDPAQERWEVWLSERSSSEVKLTVASRAMPARCGHSVTFVVADDRPVGMVNLTIGACVNFTRADPMPVLQGRDVVWPVFISLGGLMLSAFTSPLIFVVAVPLAVLYVPIVVVARWLVRGRLQSQVDVRLGQIRTEGSCAHSPSATDHSMHTDRAVPDQAQHLCRLSSEGLDRCTVAESWRR